MRLVLASSCALLIALPSVGQAQTRVSDRFEGDRKPLELELARPHVSVMSERPGWLIPTLGAAAGAAVGVLVGVEQCQAVDCIVPPIGTIATFALYGLIMGLIVEAVIP